jgi:3-oxoacyl-[acyl-carrier-protein] synthase III
VTALVEVAAHLPALSVPIEELAGELELTDRQVKMFRRFHGLATVPRQRPGETVADLLAAAAGGLPGLADRRRDVRYVLHARGMPVAAPYPANPVREVARRLGLAHAVTFTVTHQACAAGLMAIDVAGRLLAADGVPGALALVLAGEKTWTRDAQLVPDTSMSGEGAGACLVAADGPRDRVLSYVTRSRGDFDGRLGEHPALQVRFQREYPELLAEVVLTAVEQAGLTLADIRLILPHNVNLVSWRQLSRRIGFPVDRVLLDNVPVTGHSFAADVFLNHRTAAERGLLEPGMPYLVGAAGIGATVSAMVLRH